MPELAFGVPVSRSLAKDKAMEATAHILAKINHVNQQKTDGFMLTLLDKRSDLRGLPVLMGRECRTREEQARVFAEVADFLHQTLQQAKSDKSDKSGTIGLDGVEKFFAKLPATRIGLEACGASHHWARVLRALGHAVVLLPPQYIKPYVKRGKNDALDAWAFSPRT